MYREPPDAPDDSGWSFFAGDESDSYANDPQYFALYDVNTIANYDQAIIPHLDSPEMLAFERPARSDPFTPALFPGDLP
jgi:hypothetical protein